MLHISGDLEIAQGTEKVTLKTAGENQLVLSFSSWQLFGDFMRLPKAANAGFFDLRNALKHVQTPIQIKIGESHSFTLSKGKPQNISVSTLLKVARHLLLR